MILWPNRVAGKKRLFVLPKQTYYWMSLLCWWKHRNSTRLPSAASNRLVLFRPSHGWKNTMSVWWWRTTTGQRSEVMQTSDCGIHSICFCYTRFVFEGQMTQWHFIQSPELLRYFESLSIKSKRNEVSSVLQVHLQWLNLDLLHHLGDTLWLNAASIHLF